MHGYLDRFSSVSICNHLKEFPCVAILGARQIGKSTLAKKLILDFPKALYLDLESPADLAKLTEPLAFLEANRQKIICLDEIQRLPEIFPIFRSYLDQSHLPGQLLLLGSASRGLIQQSSESLAGRIAYIDLYPFSLLEVPDFQKLWLQGGYPRSYLQSEKASLRWRKNYIQTFLERDLFQLGIQIHPKNIGRLWQMLAHLNGSLLNLAKLSGALGVSSPTVKNYLDILEGTYVVRLLAPYGANIKKRLVKSPKVYLQDTGILHALLGLENFNDLLGSPLFGTSFEGLVISNLIQHLPDYKASFYRSSNGAEIDLILEKGQRKIAIEVKATQSPKLSHFFYETLDLLKVDEAYVVALVDESFPLKNSVQVMNLKTLLNHLVTVEES